MDALNFEAVLVTTVLLDGSLDTVTGRILDYITRLLLL